MIIDGHAHLGGNYRDLPSIISSLDQAGADKVILCPSDELRIKPMWIPHSLGKWGGKGLNFLVNKVIRRSAFRQEKWEFIKKGNEEVYRVAARSEGRIVQFYWANPLDPGLTDDLNRAVTEWSIKGIKLHQCAHPFKVLSDEFSRLAAFAAANKLPVFIHFHTRQEIRDFITIAGKYQVNFIVGHIIGLELFLEHRKELPGNIYFDISCPPLVSVKRTRLALEEFGAERIIMGSDTPFGKENLLAMIARIRSLDITEREKEMILGHNMQSLLHY